MKQQTGTNVIKTPGRRKSGVLKHSVLAAREEADRIVLEANEYARSTTEKADASAAEAYRESKEKGREEAMTEFQALILEAAELRDKALDESEKDLLKLSVKLAEKIVGKEIGADPKTIVEIVNTALQHARQKESLVIRVNPADVAAAQNNIEKFKSSSQSKFIDVAADPRVGPGGCLIESEVGTVDARLETQFRVLEKALLNRAMGESGNTAND